MRVRRRLVTAVGNCVRANRPWRVAFLLKQLRADPDSAECAALLLEQARDPIAVAAIWRSLSEVPYDLRISDAARTRVRPAHFDETQWQRMFLLERILLRIGAEDIQVLFRALESCKLFRDEKVTTLFLRLARAEGYSWLVSNLLDWRLTVQQESGLQEINRIARAGGLPILVHEFLATTSDENSGWLGWCIFAWDVLGFIPVNPCSVYDRLQKGRGESAKGEGQQALAAALENVDERVRVRAALTLAERWKDRRALAVLQSAPRTDRRATRALATLGDTDAVQQLFSTYEGIYWGEELKHRTDDIRAFCEILRSHASQVTDGQVRKMAFFSEDGALAYEQVGKLKDLASLEYERRTGIRLRATSPVKQQRPKSGGGGIDWNEYTGGHYKLDERHSDNSYPEPQSFSP